jgi:hypothetical protein
MTFGNRAIPGSKAVFEAVGIAGDSVVAGRQVRRLADGSASVWWCDCFGVCSPLVASLGGPLGHEKHGG